MGPTFDTPGNGLMGGGGLVLRGGLVCQIIRYQLHLVDCSTSTTRLEHQCHAMDPQKHKKKADIGEEIITRPSQSSSLTNSRVANKSVSQSSVEDIFELIDLHRP